MREANKIVDVFMERVGLFENVFGKASDKILYDTEREKVKNLLFHVNGKKDVFELFPEEFDEEKSGRVMGTMFRFSDSNNNGIPDNLENKSILGKN